MDDRIIPELSVVVLVSADAEWRAVKGYYPTVLMHDSPFGEWFLVRLLSTINPIVILHGGWGKIAAASSTQWAIDTWKPVLVVNLGTCGGFAGEVERGEVILAERTIVYDIIEQMGDFDAHIAHYTTILDLSWLRKPYPQAVLRTLLVSGDRDLIIEEIPQLNARYGAVAGDWESGAIAWVAAKNNIPCLILRGVTDLVGSDGGEAYEGNIQVFHENTSTVMKELLDTLPMWLDACDWYNSALKK